MMIVGMIDLIHVDRIIVMLILIITMILFSVLILIVTMILVGRLGMGVCMRAPAVLRAPVGRVARYVRIMVAALARSDDLVR